MKARSIPKGEFLDFQMPATTTTGKISNPDPGLSKRTQGRNISARGNLAVDFFSLKHNVLLMVGCTWAPCLLFELVFHGTCF